MTKSSNSHPIDTLSLSNTINSLKNLPRTGWTNYGITQPESVGDHSFGVAILTMFLAPHFNVDVYKSLRMALIHDLAEAIIGDVITQRGSQTLANEITKHAKERKAIVSILQSIGSPNDIDLYDEFMARATAEAQFVHQLDKLEMALQAYHYEIEYDKVLEEFLANAREHITIEALKTILKSVMDVRG